jgi:hypothetical protein
LLEGSARTCLAVCHDGERCTGSPGWQFARVDHQARCCKSRLFGPNSSLLAEGKGKIGFTLDVNWSGIGSREAWKRRNRYGARAFSTLEGYASRNQRNGVGFPSTQNWGETRGHRPGSRLRWERRQTRSSNRRASVRVRARFILRAIAAGGPPESARGSRNGPGPVVRVRCSGQGF